MVVIFPLLVEQMVSCPHSKQHDARHLKFQNYSFLTGIIAAIVHEQLYQVKYQMDTNNC